jgi:hypothetical protein
MTDRVLSIEELEDTLRAIENEAPATPSNTQQAATSSILSTQPQGAASALQLREFVDANQLKADVEFDPTDLDNAARSQAPMFVTYANLARLARRQFERMKVAVEIMESRLYAYHRDELTKEGKKATEAQIDAAVKTDKRYFAAKEKFIDARAIYDLANDAREAFSQRKDMIVQMTVDRRTERQGELRIMAADTAAESAQSARQAVLKGLAAQRAA